MLAERTRSIIIIHIIKVIVMVTFGPILSVSQPKKKELIIVGICPNIKSMVI